MRRLLIGFMAWALATAPVSAAPPRAGSNLYLSTVGVPIISNGRLMNYILVRLTLTLRPGTDVSRLTEKEPYFREALVRLAYRTHLNPANSLNRVDPALVSAKMLPLCQSIAGANVVTAVDIKYQEPQNWLASTAQTAAPKPPSEP